MGSNRKVNLYGYRRYNFKIDIAAQSSCPPLLPSSEELNYGPKGSRCSQHNQKTKQILDKYDHIILAGQWHTYYQRYKKNLQIQLMHTIERLIAKGKSVSLMAQIPIIGNYDRKCQLKLSKASCIHSSLTMVNPYPINTWLEGISKTNPTSVFYIDVGNLLCNDMKQCSPFGKETSENYPLYYDRSHLSMMGSWRLGELYIEQVRSLPEVFTNEL